MKLLLLKLANYSLLSILFLTSFKVLSSPSSPHEKTNENSSREVYHDDLNVPYEVKLQLLKTLSKHYPGPPGLAGTKSRELGIWGGISMQTSWQLETNRKNFPLWSFLNPSLTVWPYNFFVTFSNHPDSSCSDDPFVQSMIKKENELRNKARNNNNNLELERLSNPILTPVDVCLSWRDVFKAARDYRFGLLGNIVVLKKMWTAHSYSIVYSLWKYREFLVPFKNSHPKEYNFWLNWISLVLNFEKLPFLPSSEDATSPGASILMPKCKSLLDDFWSCKKDYLLKPALHILTRDITTYDKTLESYRRYLQGQEDSSDQQALELLIDLLSEHP